MPAGGVFSPGVADAVPVPPLLYLLRGLRLFVSSRLSSFRISGFGFRICGKHAGLHRVFAFGFGFHRTQHKRIPAPLPL
jgi:hypothetical protein